MIRTLKQLDPFDLSAYLKLLKDLQVSKPTIEILDHVDLSLPIDKLGRNIVKKEKILRLNEVLLCYIMVSSNDLLSTIREKDKIFDWICFVLEKENIFGNTESDLIMQMTRMHCDWLTEDQITILELKQLRVI